MMNLDITKTYKIHLKTSKGKSVKLGVSRVEPEVYNQLGFSEHHYLGNDLNKACLCLLFKDKKGNPVAFVALLCQPRRGCHNAYGISRFVILPQYQKKGFSVAIISAVGGMLTAKGKILYITTHHAGLGKALSNSKHFAGSTNDGKFVGASKFDPKYKRKMSGIAYRKKYTGKSLNGYKVLFLTIAELRSRKEKQTNRKHETTSVSSKLRIQERLFTHVFCLNGYINEKQLLFFDDVALKNTG